ncbi:hypothetical protein ACLOAU_02545 [Niabella sp. CJ426]|uniref:hypothetical protein n=1 Tax=Niabella sp. CJ426 TaxID=3393740 RepID=UPI003D07E865
MVIVHSRQRDDTTVEIIEWLQAMGKSFFRVNTLADLEFLQNAVKNQEVKSVYLNGSGMMQRHLKTDEAILDFQFSEYIAKEAEAVWYNIFSESLAGIKRFGQVPMSQAIVNKLMILRLARSLKFNVPDYEIVYRKARLAELLREWNRIICKPMVDGISIFTDRYIISGQRTEEITEEQIGHFNDTFPPTFVQKLIEKAFEVRAFYFNGKIYAIAIFTQANESSKIDGREIDRKMPQRRVPFNLPDSIQEEVAAMIELLNINYGSFDFIVSPDNTFHFLEVNPFGQYGFLSKAGNFYIEKEIAEYL